MQIVKQPHVNFLQVKNSLTAVSFSLEDIILWVQMQCCVLHEEENGISGLEHNEMTAETCWGGADQMTAGAHQG